MEHETSYADGRGPGRVFCLRPIKGGSRRTVPSPPTATTPSLGADGTAGGGLGLHALHRPDEEPVHGLLQPLRGQVLQPPRRWKKE